MIKFLNGWVKGIGVTIVIITILEMLLPNNKTKKYIQMLFGIFLIFNIVSPIVQNKEMFKFENLELGKYQAVETVSSESVINIDERFLKLYEQELKENIKSNLEEKGYEVLSAKVVAKMEKEGECEIEKIELKVNKKENTKSSLVKQIDKININTKESKEEVSLQEADIKEIKNILIKEYGVMEKCLKIN